MKYSLSLQESAKVSYIHITNLPSVPGQIPSVIPASDGSQTVPLTTRPERGVHGRHLVLLADPHVYQLPAAAPAARAAQAATQLGRAAHRVLRAVRTQVQLCQDCDTSQERRLVCV